MAILDFKRRSEKIQKLVFVFYYDVMFRVYDRFHTRWRTLLSELRSQLSQSSLGSVRKEDKDEDEVA